MSGRVTDLGESDNKVLTDIDTQCPSATFLARLRHHSNSKDRRAAAADSKVENKQVQYRRVPAAMEKDPKKIQQEFKELQEKCQQFFVGLRYVRKLLCVMLMLILVVCAVRFLSLDRKAGTRTFSGPLTSITRFVSSFL